MYMRYYVGKNSPRYISNYIGPLLKNNRLYWFFFSIKVAKYNIIIIYSTFLFYFIFMFKNLANENVYYKNAVYRLTKFYAPSVINEITKREKKYDFHFYVNTHYFLRFVY
jgi:hypothetical protein